MANLQYYITTAYCIVSPMLLYFNVLHVSLTCPLLRVTYGSVRATRMDSAAQGVQEDTWNLQLGDATYWLQWVEVRYPDVGKVT